jgi:hypothetical protein
VGFYIQLQVDDRFWTGTLAEYSNTKVINVSVPDPHTLMVIIILVLRTLFSVIVF